MADENSIGSASSSDLNANDPESTVEINVKTLDAQIYQFRVDRNMPVPSLKEKVASATGVPVDQQRLIFRGKVLKDNQLLSEYHVEDGHTLHLVVRQPVPSQAPTGANSGQASGNTDNRGNDATSGAPRNRMGISRSVVLGSFNVGDQGGEGSGPNFSQIIGAVLNSIGVGNQNSSGGGNNLSSGALSNSSSQVSQDAETDRMHGNTGGRNQTGNQMPTGQMFLNHPFQSARPSMPFPLTGAAVVIPSPQTPIPDALHTLSEYINRMELALSATGYWPTPSSVTTEDSQRTNLPSNGRGVPTPEALSIILRRAQQLMGGHAVAALSHIAGRLEGEGGSSDPAVRNQIQTESVQVGLAILHLGSLLLELGRTTLTLRMGQSPAESLVNAGPAVYISPSGPNPLMVQPFPLQTSSLFGGAASSQTVSGITGPASSGDVLRNVNIHIHAVGSRGTNGERTNQEPPSGSRSGDTGSTHPVRNVTVGAVPSCSAADAENPSPNVFYPQGTPQHNNQLHSIPAQSSSVEASSMIHPTVGNSVPQPPSESVSIPTLVAEINSQIRNLVDNLREESQALSGQSEDSNSLGLSSGTSMSDNVRNNQEENPAVNGAEEAREEQQQHECNQQRDEGEIAGSSSSQEASSTSSAGIPSSSYSVETTHLRKPEGSLGVVSELSPNQDPLGADRAVPLGLGLGGLQPKRRNRQVKPQERSSGTSCVQPHEGNLQSIATGQQVLQSLVSRGANTNARDANGPSGHLPPVLGRSMPNGAQDSNGQFDAAGMMSQVLNSPALNGLLAGVSERAGIGSPDGMRNMLEMFTQSPSMRNTINQIVQQIDVPDHSDLSGMARRQGGGFDLSRMVQQMMPIVSQALGGAPTTSEPSYGLDSREQRHCDMSGPVRVDEPDQNSQIDLHQVAQSIERNDPPGDIFRTVVEHAASLYGEGGIQDLVEELCRDDGLANEFMEMLQRNMHQRQ